MRGGVSDLNSENESVPSRRSIKEFLITHTSRRPDVPLQSARIDVRVVRRLLPCDEYQEVVVARRLPLGVLAVDDDVSKSGTL